MDSRALVGDHESAKANPSYRTDIQSLRGFAVLLVLFYHAGFYWFRAGYLGVDVFFVISGFLMTRVITDGIAAGTFRFSAFYWRRAKRLLPAAYTTFLVTALLAPGLLTAAELQSFVAQLAGALTLSGNVVLWMQTGYFQVVAELKPLLHVWSLGLEEQYYLLLPALLVFIPARRWTRSAALLLVVSLLVCLVLVARAPSATFYLLPMRAWELALGSFAAVALLDRAPSQTRLARLFWPALAVLLLIPMRPTGAPHPSLDAVLVCVATMIVLVARHPVLNQGPAPRLLAFVGDFSYSLYLVHWPIFAFLNNVYLGAPPRSVRLLAAALALLLGYALFRWVEVPVRRSALQPSRRLLAATAAATIAILAVPLAGAALWSDGIDYAERRRPNRGLSDRCDDYTNGASAVDSCRRGSTPRILIWGDSFAMQLVSGIAAVTDVDLLQTTRSTCGPILYYTAISTVNPEYDRAWAEACLAFNRSVFETLSRTPSIELVVLSSEPGNFLDPLDDPEWRALRLVKGSLVESDASTDEAIRAMQATAHAIRTLGLRVVFVAPIPDSEFDPGTCHERKATGRIFLGADSLCRISAVRYRRSRARALDMLQRLQAAGEGVVNFDAFLCGQEFCSTELDGVSLYRDAGHLSHEGSRMLARKLDLGAMLFAAAK